MVKNQIHNLAFGSQTHTHKHLYPIQYNDYNHGITLQIEREKEKKMDKVAFDFFFSCFYFFTFRWLII